MDPLAYLEKLPAEGGFNYDNCLRNKALCNNLGMGMRTNITTAKTGTTICGVVWKVSNFEIKQVLTKNGAGRCCDCS